MQRTFQRQRREAAQVEPVTGVDKASWVLTGIALVVILQLHLLTAFLAGLLVFELVHIIAPVMQRRLADRRSRIAAVAVLATLIVGVFTGVIFAAISLLKSEAGSVPALFDKMAEVIEGARSMLPAWMVQSLPDSVDDLRDTMSQWLREHAGEVRSLGAETGRGLVFLIVGMIIGAMVSLYEAEDTSDQRPLARALIERAGRVGDAFRRIVFAQVKISAVNTTFTAIYLVALLPLFGVHLPYAKTLVLVTFITGLLPVIGNLISNTVIVIVSLSVAFVVAVASLVFLIVIHKLEYFLNARIVGSRIHARPWELLIAMLCMEAAFGLPGVAAAPIYYAYLKAELADRGLV